MKPNQRRHGDRVCLAIIDLNGFKQINDSFGHAAGDEILKVISQRIVDALRDEDLVARIGGDEFAIISEYISDIHCIEVIVAKVMKVFIEPVPYKGQDLQVGGSIGISVYPDHSLDFAELQKLADHAMYHAKKNQLGWHIAGQLDDVAPMQSVG